MAEIILTIKIPDNQAIQLRMKAAYSRLLLEGEATDLNNPTNEEVRLKAESIARKHLKEVWKAEEWKMNNDSFEFIDPGMS